MKDYSKIENWTEGELYIHKSRLFVGFILGVVFGVCLMGIISILIINS